MANPQAENGHVDIAHEIIEALARYRINGESWQCLMVVFRKTYGWKKTEDEISFSQFAVMTGMKRPNVARAISWLLSRKILSVIKEDTTYANKYRFNKDFDSWVPVINKDTTGNGVITEDNEVLSPKIRKVLSPKIHTKETITKETIKRKIASPKLTDEEWIESIKANPAYKMFDVETIRHKMVAWCENKGKKPTRARLLNWLNREDKPLSGGNNGLQSGGSGGETFREKRNREAREYVARASSGVSPDIYPRQSQRGRASPMDSAIIEGSVVEVKETG